MMEELLETLFVATVIQKLIDTGNIGDFIEYGREKAKEDGMDTENLMAFFDELENEFCNDIDWDKLFDIVGETTNNRKVIGFRPDKCIIVENRTLSNDEVEDYRKTAAAPINLDKLNKALEPINIKLEFIEAVDNPFDLDGFKNFVRFKVVELDK